MNYKSLRVSADTLSALTRYRDALQVSVNANRSRYRRFAPSYRVSLGDAIDYAIEQTLAHRKRGSVAFNAGGRAKDAYLDGKASEEASDGESDEA
jgi:hypothetical protein